MQWYASVNRAVQVQACQTSVGFPAEALKSHRYKHGKLQFQIIFLPTQKKQKKQSTMNLFTIQLAYSQSITQISISEK